MVSVHVYTTASDDALTSSFTMPLETATCILKKDSGARAASRRARAIALLAAAHIRGLAPVRIDSARWRRIGQALTEFGFTPVWRQEVADAVASSSVLSNTSLDAINATYLLQDFILNYIWNHFAVALAIQPALTCWEPLAVPNDLHVQTNGSVTLTTKVRVHRPIAEVRRDVDPQNWKQCGGFWDESRLVIWAGGTFTEDPAPHDPGEHHPDNELLEEHFVCGAPCLNADFNLLLCVSTECSNPPPAAAGDCTPVNSSRFLVTYAIPLEAEGQCCTAAPCPRPCDQDAPSWWFLDGTISGVRIKPCIDDGVVQADKDSSNPASDTIVEAEKTLHFDSTQYDVGLAAEFTSYWAELNQELGELACCSP